MSILARELILNLVWCAEAEYGIALDVRGRLDGLRDASKTVLLASKVLFPMDYERKKAHFHALADIVTNPVSDAESSNHLIDKPFR